MSVAVTAAVFSALHVLAMGIGLPGIVFRARALSRNNIKDALSADNAWGIAALLAGRCPRAKAGRHEPMLWPTGEASPCFRLWPLEPESAAALTQGVPAGLTAELARLVQESVRASAEPVPDAASAVPARVATFADTGVVGFFFLPIMELVRSVF